MKYTDRIMNIVKSVMTKRDQIVGQIAELDAQLKAERITLAVCREKKASLVEQIETIRMDAAKKLQETGKAYRAAVDQGTLIDSTMLHDDAKLLQLDMKMSAHQFEALVEKHKENPLMAQLLQDYSNKHEGLYAVFIPTREAKITAFDGFVGAALNTIRTPDSFAASMFQDGKYTPQICTESE